MSIESERDALASALAFYATPRNYRAVELPMEFAQDDPPQMEDGDGNLVAMKLFQSGPAMDGGDHARYVLGLLRNGEL